MNFWLICSLQMTIICTCSLNKNLVQTAKNLNYQNVKIRDFQSERWHHPVFFICISRLLQSLSHGPQPNLGQTWQESVQWWCIPSAVLGREQIPRKGLQTHSGEKAQASSCHIQNESSWDIREHKSTIIKTFLYYKLKVHSKTTKGINFSGLTLYMVKTIPGSTSLTKNQNIALWLLFL